MSEMNLCRGNCILCTNCNKIVCPPGAYSITKLIPDILEKFVDVGKLDSVTLEYLKICPTCLQDILLIAEHKTHIGDYEEHPNKCSICQCEENILSITDWSYFDTLIQTILRVEKQRLYIVCLKCVKYLELVQRIKTNFIMKYPQLALQETPKRKNTKEQTSARSTPNKNRFSVDSHTSKPHQGVDLQDALRHLKPLQLLNFDLNQFQDDKKLMNQVAFVKLSMIKPVRKGRNITNGKLNDSNTSPTDTTPRQSFFKIKLKMTPSFKKKKISRVPTRKIEKPTLRPAFFNHKELIVKLRKVDLEKLVEVRPFSSITDSTIPPTPTKASRKFIEEPVSSSKKRKSVTFAPNLNEVMDELSCRKNTAQSPIKSLLKKSYSPSPELFASEQPETEDENEVVSKANVNFDKNVDSDDEGNRIDTYTEYIKKNSDSIFESLKFHEVEKSTESTATHDTNGSDSDSEIVEPSVDNKDDSLENNDNELEDSTYSEKCNQEKSEGFDETAIRNTFDEDKVEVDNVNSGDELENQPLDENVSSMNGLAEENHCPLKTNVEENSDDSTKKRRLSDDNSDILRSDNDEESESKRLKQNESDMVIQEIINGTEPKDMSSENECIDNSDRVANKDDISKVLFEATDEDTCKENGKLENNLDLRTAEV